MKLSINFHSTGRPNKRSLDFSSQKTLSYVNTDGLTYAILSEGEGIGIFSHIFKNKYKFL